LEQHLKQKILALFTSKETMLTTNQLRSNFPDYEDRKSYFRETLEELRKEGLIVRITPGRWQEYLWGLA